MPDLSRLSYSLQFDDDGIGLPRRVEFEASNAGAALEIVEEQCDGRWAVLLCDGTALCRVGHSAGAWMITAYPAPGFVEDGDDGTRGILRNPIGPGQPIEKTAQSMPTLEATICNEARREGFGVKSSAGPEPLQPT